MKKASAETTEKERSNVEENAGTLSRCTKFRNIFKVALFIYLINYLTSIFTTVKTGLNRLIKSKMKKMSLHENLCQWSNKRDDDISNNKNKKVKQL